MIQLFTAHLGRTDKDFQIIHQLWLTGKVLHDRGPDIIFKLLLGRAQCVLILIQIKIRHLTNILKPLKPGPGNFR
jgi:hypothetical protein